MKKFNLSVVVMLIYCTFAFAQNDSKSTPYKDWEIGVNAGVANFSGEYIMYKDSRFKHPQGADWQSFANIGFGALLKKNFSHVFALELGWNYANLSGNSYTGLPFPPAPEYKTEVNEYDLNSVWNLNNLFSKNKLDRKLYWYAKLGIGYSNVWKKKGLPGVVNGENWKFPTIPLGAGVSYRLSDHVKINVGTQWSWINTDRLDGHYTASTSANTKAGNTQADIFGTKLYTHAGLSYSFGKKKKSEPVVEVLQPQPQIKPQPELKPEPKQESQKAEVTVVAKPAVIGNVYKVYFAFDKWDLNNQSLADLDRLAADMNQNPTVNVEIKSYTDSRGPANYNMKLSEKRGKSVIDYLSGKGVSSSRVNAQAFGESQPVNKCVDGVSCTKAEYALNRRTETIVIE